MALVRPNWNYIFIDPPCTGGSQITIKIFESKEQKNVGETDFIKPMIECVNIPTLDMLLDVLVPNNLDTFNNQIKTICYSEMRKQDRFSDCVDDFTPEQEPIVESIKQAIEEIIPPAVENTEEVVENIE